MFRECIEIDKGVADRMISKIHEDNLSIEIELGIVKRGMVKISAKFNDPEEFNKTMSDSIKEEFDFNLLSTNMTQRKDKRVAFYKAKGFLSHEDEFDLRQESVEKLEHIKETCSNKKIVKINPYTWLEVDKDIPDEKVRKRFFKR